MGRLFTKDNVVPLLILFLLFYGTFSYCFHFFLNNIVTHLLLLALVVCSSLSFNKNLLKVKPIKIFSMLLAYNVCLYVVGFAFVTDKLYLNFYISFFILTMVFVTFYYFSTHIVKTLSMLGIIITYVLPVYTVVLALNTLVVPNNLMYDKFSLSFFPMLYLFLPFCSKKMFWMSALFSLFVIMREADFRALVLLNLFGFFIYFVYAMRTLFTKRLLRLFAYGFLCLPIVLLFLSITTNLNPFTLMDDSIFASFSLGNEKINLAGDSRSYFYSEIYNHLCKYNALLWGTTPGIGYQTSLAEVSDSFYELLKIGRIDTEVGILEFFHYGGFINVTLLFAFFWTFIKNVFKNSRNRFSYVVCVFVAFRWFFLFMEGDVVMYMQWISLLLIMGLFCNKTILHMTDGELLATMKYYLKENNGKL